MAATFHVQLSKSLLQRRLNGCDFLRTMIFFHCGLGSRDRSLRRALVNMSRVKRHISEHGYRVALNFNKAFTDSESRLPSVFQHSKFAGFEGRQKRDMVRIN